MLCAYDLKSSSVEIAMIKLISLVYIMIGLSVEPFETGKTGTYQGFVGEHFGLRPCIHLE